MQEAPKMTGFQRAENLTEFKKNKSEDFKNLEQVKYAFDFMEKNVPIEKYPFHGGRIHAQDVMETAIKIANLEGVDEHNLEILVIACAFHDTGFAKQYDKNEKIGAKIASEYLASKNIANQEIAKIQQMILSTQVDFSPVFFQHIFENDILDKIIADADVANFGRADFFEKAEKIFQELCIHKNLKADQASHDIFNMGLLAMLKTHTWQTKTATELYHAQKLKNIQLLERSLVA